MHQWKAQGKVLDSKLFILTMQVIFLVPFTSKGRKQKNCVDSHSNLGNGMLQMTSDIYVVKIVWLGIYWMMLKNPTYI